jgi:hypothetical protein
VFICDRCARAELRFAALIVLCLWVPVLVAFVLLTTCQVVASVVRLNAFNHGSLMRNIGIFLVLGLPTLYLAAGLIRMAWKQLVAARYGLYHQPPASGPVAKLAIQLRKKQILRSLHMSEGDVRFLTEADRGIATGQSGQEWSERGA